MIALSLKARAFSISWEEEKREINNFLSSKRRPGRTLGKFGNKKRFPRFLTFPSFSFATSAFCFLIFSLF